MNTTVLVVTEDDSAYSEIRAVLAGCSLAILHTRSYPGAIDAETAVIVCDAEFGAYTWRHVLDLAKRLSKPPVLIVIARLATDRLWLDLLDEGVFDLFSKASLDGNFRRAVLISLQDWNRERNNG